MISILVDSTKKPKGSGVSRQDLAERKSLWLASICSLALIAGPADAQAGAKEKFQTMVYSVYAGGINAVQARLQIDDSRAERYKMALSAKTRGFLARLAPWHGSFETEGWKEGEQLQPELHKSISTWKEETEIKEYVYTKGGDFAGLRITEEGEDKSPGAIDSGLTQGTTDALTATLLVMQGIKEKGSCEGASEVFDGERRFELKFHNKGNAVLKASSYNVYEGPAVICEVEIEPRGGKWHSKPRGWFSIQEQGRKKGYLPRLWLASMGEGIPAVPVKVQVKTDYGSLMAHLTGYEGAGVVTGNLDSDG
ncbi:MAG: DUF3108 domain-containing protein [Alphaproteobacteria bacterium]|nr:DUF3108 domain-containing protein [Alphaproteobacteria bacterium]